MALGSSPPPPPPPQNLENFFLIIVIPYSRDYKYPSIIPLKYKYPFESLLKKFNYKYPLDYKYPSSTGTH